MIIYDNNYAIFNNVKFRLDQKTGYYRNSTLRKNLHRYIWEFFNGTAPTNCHVHHIDHNKSNNDIKNLTLIEKTKHFKYHGKENAKNNEWINWAKKNLNENARPKAIEWHKSNEGKEWHKKHYENTKEKLHNKKNFSCIFCSKEFFAQVTGKNKFCSNKCKSTHRRKTGVDNETRNCKICKKQFESNKYSKTQHCSKSCANKSKKNTLYREK